MSKQGFESRRARLVYLSHGGGPLPILGEPSHEAMVTFMRQLASRLGRPEAILVVSAHWEEQRATLLGAPAPPMLYDYYGFPAEAYAITYPAPGSPELARRIAGMLNEHAIPAGIDPQRGFDHGVFIPLMLMYPQADIPALQLSLLSGLDPAAHLSIGKALCALMGEDILVIGSGFSFHNLRAFTMRGIRAPDPENDAFQDWLIETCTGPMPQSERERRLIAWERAPGARACHPREEHLLPLHVCLGMAQAPAAVVFDDTILGKRAVAFAW
jgi:aromatic ring-opening dioxygenase catalytic subunit (LigB family)